MSITTIYSIDLRPSEITLLRRALAIYGRFYQDLMAKSEPQWEKDDLKKMIAAAELVSERLFTETRSADTISQAVLNRVMEELRTMEHGDFTNDAAGWEKAAEALVKSLTR